ncbi:YdcF family protein [Kineococcus sp. SYSU DK001]|uniref:YdcF family protein n=1 Tax=Kineococcus sp. SYSU DK001 TaxID=3383122 RepID=UPI003D7D3F9A
MSRGARVAVPGALTGALVVWLGVEAVHAVAARRGLPAGARRAGHDPDVVVVLGCPPRPDGSAGAMQRWRTLIAVRTSGRALLVFSGFAREGLPSEAAVMAAHAVDVLGCDPRRVRCEESARSTWQNVEFTVGQVAPGQRLAIASSPVHAWRARRYLARQRPDLAARLVPAADYRFGERWGLKALTVLYDGGRSLTLRWPGHRRRAP